MDRPRTRAADSCGPGTFSLSCVSTRIGGTVLRAGGLDGGGRGPLADGDGGLDRAGGSPRAAIPASVALCSAGAAAVAGRGPRTRDPAGATARAGCLAGAGTTCTDAVGCRQRPATAGTDRTARWADGRAAGDAAVARTGPSAAARPLGARAGD